MGRILGRIEINQKSWIHVKKNERSFKRKKIIRMGRGSGKNITRFIRWKKEKSLEKWNIWL